MRKIFSLITTWYPYILLLAVEAFLFFANYTLGTFLMGWDNVMPEFNFGANWERSLIGVWQEHRGLGLYDGMSHIANLLHTTFIWMLSFVFPLNTLRYIFTFFAHFMGMVGMYQLLSSKFKVQSSKLMRVFGALFYGFNLITVQMFYAPLEAFSVHFVALPWLAYSLMLYLEKSDKRSLLVFSIVSLLITPQYFVTTLFIPTVLLLTVISVVHLFQNKSHLKNTFKAVFTAGVVFILINAFWLFPYVYGLPKNAPVIQAAKINQMSSDEVFARNRAFGNLGSVLTLKGFTLDFLDYVPDVGTIYMMQSWRDHLAQPVTQVLTWLIVIVMGIGLVASIVQRKSGQKSFYALFMVLFSIGFFMLGNDIPVIAELVDFLRGNVPFFGEAFRFAFTKFSLLYVLCYTIFLVIGLQILITFAQRVWKYLGYIILTLFFVGLICLSSPSFTGNFIYPHLRVNLPTEYFSLFQFMETQDLTGRTAVLPQSVYWSWKQYRFDFRGSGFMWYGLHQPLMDRAFDPWSAENENYYWELSQALYSKDTAALERVFTKYDISYIIQDQNLMSSTNPRSLFNSDIEELFSQMPTVRKLKDFDRISVYAHSNPSIESFVGIYQNVPHIQGDFTWLSNDQAYIDLGTYISANEDAGVLYPYRPLFTKRSVDEREFTTTETNTELFITTENHRYVLPKSEMLVYDSATTNDLSNQSLVACGSEQPALTDAAHKQEDGISYLQLMTYQKRICLSFGIPSIELREGYIVVVESRHVAGRPLLFSMINETAKHVELETYLPSKTDWQTTYFILPPIAPDGLGYSFYISNDAIGRYESINDLARIRMYKLPYQELQQVKTGFAQASTPLPTSLFTVQRNNPAWYTISLDQNIPSDTTLVLNQAFNSGWVAVERIETFPYFKKLNGHVLVNNWANAWKLEKRIASREEAFREENAITERFTLNANRTIMIVFWPQYLQYLGFLLLPVPFVYFLRRKTSIK